MLADFDSSPPLEAEGPETAVGASKIRQGHPADIGKIAEGSDVGGGDRPKR
jgi:hypothetical protein